MPRILKPFHTAPLRQCYSKERKKKNARILLSQEPLRQARYSAKAALASGNLDFITLTASPTTPAARNVEAILTPDAATQYAPGNTTREAGTLIEADILPILELTLQTKRLFLLFAQLALSAPS